MSEHSVNARAEAVVGRRLTPDEESVGVVPIDCPCELGYWCPKCRVEWDERLAWSEYAGFLWCPGCNFDWPSALCVRVDAAPDPTREWMHLGREAAVEVFLDTVQEAVHRSAPKLEHAALLAKLAEARTFVEWAAEHYCEATPWKDPSDAPCLPCRARAWLSPEPAQEGKRDDAD